MTAPGDHDPREPGDAGDPGDSDEVTRALRDVVVALGRPAAFDPARLRLALTEALAQPSAQQSTRDGGRRAGEFIAQVDALVVAAEEGVPVGMLEDVPAIDLGDRLDARGMPPEQIGWVLVAWGRVVQLARPSGGMRPAPARDRRKVLVAVAAAVLVVAVAGVLIGGLSRGGAEPAGVRTAAQATPSASVPPAPAAPGVLAHRGGRERFPADTLPGLLDAAKAGYAVETDLRWTSDGVGVLVNSASVEPPMYCAQRYVIARVTWAQLRASCLTQASRSPDGRSYGIARLTEAVAGLAAVPDAQLYLELKVEQTAAQRSRLLEVLKARDLTDRTVLTSFLPDELAAVAAAAKADGSTVRLMQFVRDRALTPEQARTAGLWAVAVQQRALKAGYVGELRAAGLKVVAWTPNTPAQWTAARAAGVDLLDTDVPRAYSTWVDKLEP